MDVAHTLKNAAVVVITLGVAPTSAPFTLDLQLILLFNIIGDSNLACTLQNGAFAVFILHLAYTIQMLLFPFLHYI